jgi:hypothetical protein
LTVLRLDNQPRARCTVRPLPASDLARDSRAFVRAAYRDLDFLRDEWRMRLEFDRHKGTHRLTDTGRRAARLPQLLRARRDLLRGERAQAVPRNPFEPDLASAFKRISELLLEEVKVSAEGLDD